MILNTRLLVLAISTVVVISGHAPNIWTPQLGTTSFPKNPKLSPVVTKGDVYQFENGLYYKALIGGMVHEMPHDSQKHWRELVKGSMYLPKVLYKDPIESIGEIFIKDMDSNMKYFKSKCVPDSSKIKLSVDDDDCLVEYTFGKDWMKEIRLEINDTRLGDLAIPGSHNTGTDGINEDSFLVDKSFLFSLGDLVVPEVMANWSFTQDVNIQTQLESGFRQLDLRVADCESLNDTFRWWHGLTGDIIDEGLQHIAEFSGNHPDEIILIYFQHFRQPGNVAFPTREISRARKVELSDLILGYLSEYLVPYVDISDNPTVNEVLATGKNVIALVQDDDIREMSDLYWPYSIVHTAYVGHSNSEDIFNDRSEKLKDYLINHSDSITDISGAITPAAVTVASSIITIYGDLPIVDEVLERLGLEHFDPKEMSFEGLYVDLLSVAIYGTNTNGMYARPGDMYSNGASVHYRGVNDMFRHWLARPGLYKPNILYNDDSSEISSTIVSTAIMANLGEIPKEASVSFQGNTRDGFYKWTINGTEGADEGLNCQTVDVEFILQSSKYGIHKVISSKGINSKKSSKPERYAGFEFVMQEGEYPPDAEIIIQVGSPGYEETYDLYTFNVDSNIQNTLDLYVRGDDFGDGHGFAYVSVTYNHFGAECGSPPTSDYLAIQSW